MTDSRFSAQAPGEDTSVQFRELFDREFGYVCRALSRLGVRPGDVDDVAQELFLTVHRALPTLDPQRPVRPWLCGFSVKFAANYRRLGRLTEAPESEIAAQRATTSDPEARDFVLKVLERLDFDRRAVVVMHDLEGFAAPEIAAELSVPLNTVYSRLRLAREDLKAVAEELQLQGGES